MFAHDNGGSGLGSSLLLTITKMQDLGCWPAFRSSDRLWLRAIRRPLLIKLVCQGVCHDRRLQGSCHNNSIWARRFGWLRRPKEVVVGRMRSRRAADAMTIERMKERAPVDVTRLNTALGGSNSQRRRKYFKERHVIFRQPYHQGASCAGAASLDSAQESCAPLAKTARVQLKACKSAVGCWMKEATTVALIDCPRTGQGEARCANQFPQSGISMYNSCTRTWNCGLQEHCNSGARDVSEHERSRASERCKGLWWIKWKVSQGVLPCTLY